MAYLRSLEGFRKNPHVKIPPKSPPTNFQSLGIFKKQILFGKEFFHHFGPSFGFWPSRGPPPFSFPNWPFFFLPRWASAARSAQLATRRWHPARLPPPSRGDASSRTAFAPLHTRLTGGPTCHPSPLAPLELGRATTASRHSLRRPAPHLGMPPEPLLAPPSLPP
jgi:hypothetical protein